MVPLDPKEDVSGIAATSTGAAFSASSRSFGLPSWTRDRWWPIQMAQFSTGRPGTAAREEAPHSQIPRSRSACSSK